jgi:hypothetical protein
MAQIVIDVALLLLLLRLLQLVSSQTPITYSTTGLLTPGGYIAPTYGCTVTVMIVGGGGGASRNAGIPAAAAGGGGASFQVSFFSDGVTPFNVSAYGQGGTGFYIASGTYGGGGGGGGATAIYAGGTLLAVAGGGGGAACRNVSGTVRDHRLACHLMSPLPPCLTRRVTRAATRVNRVEWARPASGRLVAESAARSLLAAQQGRAVAPQGRQQAASLPFQRQAARAELVLEAVPPSLGVLDGRMGGPRG